MRPGNSVHLTVPCHRGSRNTLIKLFLVPLHEEKNVSPIRLSVAGGGYIVEKTIYVYIAYIFDNLHNSSVDENKAKAIKSIQIVNTNYVYRLG